MNIYKQIIFILIIIALVIVIIFFSVKTYKLFSEGQKPAKKKKSAAASPVISVTKNSIISDSRNAQTDFYNSSVQYAEKVLWNNASLDGYRYGSRVELSKLNDATKKSISNAMQYLIVEGTSPRYVEQEFRTISEQENVPLWFVILHEAVKKLIPMQNKADVHRLSTEELVKEIARRNIETTGKIIPISQAG